MKSQVFRRWQKIVSDCWCPLWQHVSDLGSGTSNCESPAGCQQLKTWRAEPADDRIDPPPEREAPSRPYREESFSLSRFGSVSKVLSAVSVSSRSRRSRIASALSLHPCNATLGALASGGVTSDLLTGWIRCTSTYCASQQQQLCPGPLCQQLKCRLEYNEITKIAY